MSKTLVCPVCDQEALKHLDLPKYSDLWQCEDCREICQVLSDGAVNPLGDFLDRSALGDDRTRAAISRPDPTDLKGIVEVFENSTRMWQMDLASVSGSLRTVLQQALNRVDFALAKFADMGLASDDAADGIRALEELRKLIDPRPRSGHGFPASSD